jgi:Flp pilus assembly protein CpaB
LASHGEEAVPIVVVARDVDAGHVLTSEDLRAADLHGTDGLELVEAESADVLGRRVAIPLRAGTPLPRSALAGADEWPERGRAVVAVALPEATVPSALAAGSAVGVVITEAVPLSAPRDDEEGDEPTAVTPGVPVMATVHTVRRPAEQGAAETTVELGMARADAPLVAAAGSENVRLVLVHGHEQEEA